MLMLLMLMLLLASESFVAVPLSLPRYIVSLYGVHLAVRSVVVRGSSTALLTCVVCTVGETRYHTPWKDQSFDRKSAEREAVSKLAALEPSRPELPKTDYFMLASPWS